MITPILVYGTEVWGCKIVDIVDKFYLNFCKSLLDVKQTTPSVVVYGELGAMPLHLKMKRKSRVLNFRYRIVSGKRIKSVINYINLCTICMLMICFILIG